MNNQNRIRFEYFKSIIHKQWNFVLFTFKGNFCFGVKFIEFGNFDKNNLTDAMIFVLSSALIFFFQVQSMK